MQILVGEDYVTLQLDLKLPLENANKLDSQSVIFTQAESAGECRKRILL